MTPSSVAPRKLAHRHTPGLGMGVTIPVPSLPIAGVICMPQVVHVDKDVLDQEAADGLPIVVILSELSDWTAALAIESSHCRPVKIVPDHSLYACTTSARSNNACVRAAEAKSTCHARKTGRAISIPRFPAAAYADLRTPQKTQSPGRDRG